jgi:hypothetical protein
MRSCRNNLACKCACLIFLAWGILELPCCYFDANAIAISPLFYLSPIKLHRLDPVSAAAIHFVDPHGPCVRDSLLSLHEYI